MNIYISCYSKRKIVLTECTIFIC